MNRDKFMIRDKINAAARKIPKWAAYFLGLIPFAILVWGAVNNTLGVDPVKAIEHRLGEVGLQLLIGGLAITPMMKIGRINLMKFRRVLGVLAFFFISMHFLTWAVLDMSLLWSEIAKDLVKRWYVIIGMAGFVLMIPLALTSNNWAVRKMGGAAWRRLHRAVYAIGLLGGLHFVLLVKGFQIEPMVYLGICTILLALRLPGAKRLRVA